MSLLSILNSSLVFSKSFKNVTLCFKTRICPSKVRGIISFVPILFTAALLVLSHAFTTDVFAIAAHPHVQTSMMVRNKLMASAGSDVTDVDSGVSSSTQSGKYLLPLAKSDHFSKMADQNFSMVHSLCTHGQSNS